MWHYCYIIAHIPLFISLITEWLWTSWKRSINQRKRNLYFLALSKLRNYCFFCFCFFERILLRCTFVLVYISLWASHHKLQRESFPKVIFKGSALVAGAILKIPAAFGRSLQYSELFWHFLLHSVGFPRISEWFLWWHSFLF